MSETPELPFSTVFSTLKLECRITTTLGTDLCVLETNVLITLFASFLQLCGWFVFVVLLVFLKLCWKIRISWRKEAKIAPCTLHFRLKSFLQKTPPALKVKFLPVAHLIVYLVYNKRIFTGSASPSSGCTWELHIAEGKFQSCTVYFIDYCS